MLGFKNANVYVEDKGIIKTDIAFEGDVIAAIGENLTVDEIESLTDNAVIVPGFIDEHIHGAAGADAMDGSVEALSKIAEAVASEGTTAFLATTMTQSPENITKALKAVDTYVKLKKDSGAEILGVHLEGPFISPKHIGAQPLEYVAKPSVETFKKYEEASGNLIKIVTMAPEQDETGELIKYLNQKGIVASIGHTGATYAQAERGVDLGAKSVTHTYNAQTPLHHRDAGVVGAAISDDRLNCEIICDTIHVSVPAINLIIKNKPHDKVTLITDSMRAKHMPDGISELGGQTVIVKGGEARLTDGTLAGSVLKMSDAVKNLTQKAGVSFVDAVDFATASPAKNIGVYDKMGSIKVGKLANVTVLNKNDFSVLLTVRNGKVIYKKTNA